MLEFNKVNAFYGKKQIIFNANLKINSGITCVLGKNGSGKTTLMSLILNQINYNGDIFLKGENIQNISIQHRAKQVSFLPQNVSDTSLTVYELVMLARIPYLNFNKAQKEDIKAVNSAIEVVRLKEKANQKVSELSGGEKQRAYLALMLAKQTDIYIFDEPLSFLDPEFTALFLKIVNDLKNEGKCIVIIMHDVNKAVEIADDILLINNGSISFFGSKERAINAEILEKEFNLKRYEITENNEKEYIFK